MQNSTKFSAARFCIGLLLPGLLGTIGLMIILALEEHSQGLQTNARTIMSTAAGILILSYIGAGFQSLLYAITMEHYGQRWRGKDYFFLSLLDDFFVFSHLLFGLFHQGLLGLFVSDLGPFVQGQGKH